MNTRHEFDKALLDLLEAGIFEARHQLKAGNQTEARRILDHIHNLPSILRADEDSARKLDWYVENECQRFVPSRGVSAMFRLAHLSFVDACNATQSAASGERAKPGTTN